ncbi:MAG: YlxM family DNA-binding protein [Oscillospiraceae bacterium]
MDDNTLRRSMLFDFYGELLTEKQRDYYDLHYNEDFSLSEIAEQSGISRQGVWDIIRRADKILGETEEKTGLIRRFEQLRLEVSLIEARVLKIRELSEGECAELATEVLDRLQSLKN